MSSNTQRNAARMAGALVGVGLALALLFFSRPGAAGSPLPAAVRVTVAPMGELEVTPAPPRPVFVADALRPGGPSATGGFLVRNQTGANLAVALAASANSTALDGLLRLRVEAAGRVLADTTLQGLRARALHLRLASGEGARLRLRAWLPEDILSGYEGRLVEVSLSPEVRQLGGSG
jgi:hypothetical protein